MPKNSYKGNKMDMRNQVDWFEFFYNNLLELSINRFRWINLPIEIDPRFMELTIFRNGNAVFFHDYIMGYLALAGAYSGLDVQNNPTYYHVVTPTGYAPNIDLKKEGVVIWNNYTRVSEIGVIYNYASALADMINTALINIRGQKHPIVVIAENESQRMSLENAYAKLDGNHPVIYTKRSLNIGDAFQTINAQVPYIADKLFDNIRFMLQECYKYLGINVSNEIKKERMIEREATDNNAITYQSRNRGLNPRKDACRRINKMYGLNLDVEFDEEITGRVFNLGGDIE